MIDRQKYLSIASVTVMPRAVYVLASSLAWLTIVAGAILCLWASFGADTGRIVGGWGGGLGCALGGLGALYGTKKDWQRRPNPVLLLHHLQGRSIVPMARIWFWNALLVLVIGLVLMLCGQPKALWLSPVFMGSIWMVCAAFLRAMHAHLLRRARAVFTLYAEGVLEPADAVAIDDARAKNPDFDRAVREHQKINAALREL